MFYLVSKQLAMVWYISHPCLTVLVTEPKQVFYPGLNKNTSFQLILEFFLGPTFIFSTNFIFFIMNISNIESSSINTHAIMIE